MSLAATAGTQCGALIGSAMLTTALDGIVSYAGKRSAH